MTSTRLATSFAIVTMLTAAVFGQQVTKVADNFGQPSWTPNQWNRAGGSAAVDADDHAPGTPADGSLKLTVKFSGNGFEFFSVDSAAPLYIPGDAESITLRLKRSDAKHGVSIGFIDGWRRDKVDNKDLKWEPKLETTGQWETHTFEVPDDWVRPIAINKIGTHNWSDRQTKKTFTLHVDDLQATTDITNVDPATGQLTTWQPNPENEDATCPATPLLSVDVASDDRYNLFSRKAPGASVTVRNWRPGDARGNVTWTISEYQGEPVGDGSKEISVASVASVPLALDVERFGVYNAKVSVEMADGQHVDNAFKFAKLPPYHQLTEEQQLKSPYGMNVHSGNGVVVDPFRRAGVVWFRDYAFSYDWLVKARGDDRSYTGWPWYHRIMADYAEQDVKILACLMGAIQTPRIEDGKPVESSIGPDEQWMRNVADVLLHFDQITHWELDNEYDLNAANHAAEVACDWRNYGAFHREFGNLVAMIGQGNLVATQNGCAGVHPDWVERHVKRGDFDNIQVVNSHHYCGTDAPELNMGNFNTGFDEGHRAEQPGLYFDQLRAQKRAGQLDGQHRESWHTEFGWDALAGKIVSRYEQAVYLPRSWMLGMAAGTDKMFWFWNFDAEDPKTFFGGMGLLDADHQPNLCIASLSAMAYLMPTPNYVGEINAGDGTQGYVFEQDGKLIAALWSIETDDGPPVTFNADQLHDYLANPIDGKQVQLKMAPTYAVGLSKAGPLYAQTAYSIDTNHMVVATAGETIRPVILVDNNRDKPIQATIKTDAPDGWWTESAVIETNAGVGSQVRKEIPLKVDVNESLGIKEVFFEVSEPSGTIKRMKMFVLVQPPLAMEVAALRGEPGQTAVSMRVRNNASTPLDATLALNLPDTWKTSQPTMAVESLKPGEVRDIELPLTWSATWPADQTAGVTLSGPGGFALTKPVIPTQFTMHKATNITIDGKLDDWSADQRVPAWMLGSTVGESRSEVYFAWSDRGLYGALRVNDSQVSATDPRSFWSGDVYELWIDTRNDKQRDEAGFVEGDHQFWLVPQVADDRVYVGQWKRADEITETRYDITGIESVSKRIEGGYLIEFLLPASELKGYNPKVGSLLGLNFNVSVKNKQFDREVYWPRRKNEDIGERPDTWGTAKLAE